MGERLREIGLAVLVFMLAASPAAASTILTFSGVFSQDDDVAVVPFSITELSLVTLQTYSYAGGTNSLGEVIPGGGFDPILSLFDATGNLIAIGDDGGSGVDPVTLQALDAFFTATLDPGNYTLTVTQWNNFPAGTTLGDGFEQEGQGDFTADFGDCSPDRFIDFTGSCRTGAFAGDIQATSIPEPAAPLLLLTGLAGAMARARRRKISGKHRIR